MIGILTAACAPAIALLLYFYLKDQFELEPFHMVIRSYVFGGLLVFPVMFIQYAVITETGISSSFLLSVILAPFTEEFLKWFTVMFTVYFHMHFNQRYDGIVYACAVGLGFASVENIFYLIENGLDTAFLRAVFPVTSHALFGVVMGYYFGLAKFSAKRKTFLLISFLVPLLLHSVYNVILLAPGSWAYLLVTFMIFMWIFAMKKVKSANKAQAADEWRFS
ncbi:glutamic-type intramembrane protease PrsW [Alkalicoccus daliensis]|uniref:Protease PrsW n=1 Tax=Alkalicoccus daliensis TaxID=745820 RepID=A0A1H0AWT4_9BACI|nr:glutamic-type intramembrane protease PrsW [Alkalicoccus daliensis]SDN37904.1 Membrane proteinase PrsW, cleaves anti-sigma factor RsiW, M82 family [Alkalicoccus daliensis]